MLSLFALLERNSQQINKVVRGYQTQRSLSVIDGLRPTLPVDAYPSMEIEPTNADNIWATTRAQRPTYNFECTVTVRVDNLKYGVEYITTLSGIVCEIMTSPENLQLKIVNETRWDANAGLVDVYMLDSLVTTVTYNAVKDGSIRMAEFSWFVLVHEPFPESKWLIGDFNMPSIVRPQVLVL